jgi:hypothetical protein
MHRATVRRHATNVVNRGCSSPVATGQFRAVTYPAPSRGAELAVQRTLNSGNRHGHIFFLEADVNAQ